MLRDEIINWLESYKKNSVKAGTYDRLLESYRLMNEYSISTMPLDEITCDVVQKYINELTDDGYSLTTIKKQFLLITAFYKHMIARGEQKVPIYLGVSLPSEDRVSKKRKDIEIYTTLEQVILRRELVTVRKPVYVAILLMLECGLRAGEALALKWSDINFGRKCVRIHSTLVRLSAEGGKIFVQDSAKTKTSNRTIPLSETAIKALQKLKAECQYSDYVIASNDYRKPLTFSGLRYAMKNLCMETGVENRGFHALRHTFASNCYNKGADVKLLSKLLGHADTSITYNTYIHLFGDELEAMRSVLS